MRPRAPLLFSLSLLAAACGPETAPQRPRHVLLIVVDTLRADALGSLGSGRATSPRLDELARGGVLFERAVAQSSWTSPSMVSMMTGHYIAGARLDLPPELPTLPEVFRKNGYATACFWSNGMISQENGFGRGIEVFEQVVDYQGDEPIARWVADRKAGPTFTYVHLIEPHDPYGPPGEAGPFRKQGRELSAERLAYYADLRERLGLEQFDEHVAEIESELGGYDDDVAYVDGRIANILELYRAAGMLDQTLVVVASDHGECLWTREAFLWGQRGKKLRNGEPPTLLNSLMPTHGNQVNHELVHVPLILAGPGVPAGVRVGGLVENVDLFPTLLELCDLKTPGGLQGRSLVAAMKAPDGNAGKLHAFSFTRWNSTLLTDEGLQLILPSPLGECQEGLEVELYDLNADPEARVNLAAHNPELVESLRGIVLAHLRRGIGPSDVQVSAATLKTLAGLGYVDVLESEQEKAALRGMKTQELVDLIVDPPSACMLRLESAKALLGRELSPEQRATLRTHLETTESAAVVISAVEALLR